METYKSLKDFKFNLTPRAATRLLKYEKHGNLWLTDKYIRGMITLRDTYGGPVKGTTFYCFEKFQNGDDDPTFEKLHELLAEALTKAGLGRSSRLGVMEEFALTNFIEKPYPGLRAVSYPPPVDFVRSETPYEDRIKRLKPKAFLVLMGTTKEEDGKVCNQWAMDIIKKVNNKAPVFSTCHPSFLVRANKKKGSPEWESAYREVRRFIKVLYGI